MQLDSLDIKILNTLVDDGRASIESVGGTIGLSPTPTRRRINRLENEKVITGYRAEIEPDRAVWKSGSMSWPNAICGSFLIITMALAISRETRD